MTDYNDGLIHGWNGGDCPVHPQTEIEAWFTEGGSVTGKAEGLYWSDCGKPVVAFRVVKEFKELREFWICDYNIFSSKQGAELSHSYRAIKAPIIHVREVLE